MSAWGPGDATRFDLPERGCPLGERPRGSGLREVGRAPSMARLIFS